MQDPPEIMQICDIFRAKIVNVAHTDVIIEITGDEVGRSGPFLGLVEPFGILELARAEPACTQAADVPEGLRF